jgi:flagellar biogenesis protein FliO
MTLQDINATTLAQMDPEAVKSIAEAAAVSQVAISFQLVAICLIICGTIYGVSKLNHDPKLNHDSKEKG